MYPKAVADFWISFLFVKKLIFVNGSIVSCRPIIVSDSRLTGFEPAEFPDKKSKKKKKIRSFTSTAGPLIISDQLPLAS